MLYSYVNLGLALTLAGNVFAGPIELRAQQCNGQSCQIAAISGSSGQPIDPTINPQGDTVSGDCCIISYRPEIAPIIYQYRPEVRGQCNSTTSSKAVLTARDALYKRELDAFASEMGFEAFVEEEEDVSKRAACSQKTVVYAKGTTEPGTLGVTLGPKLQRTLNSMYPGVWSVQGVSYTANTAGDYCLGLPGGVAAKALLQQIAASCPSTKLFVAGYSQGAMVVRDGLANSTLGSRVKGVLTFGDPFDGAPVKGFNGPIKTYCADGDQVCSGLFKISGAHLSYGANVTEAAMFLNSV